MSEIGENLKNLVLKGIGVIGTKANDIASGAKQKVGEFNLANEQKELFSAIGRKVFEMFRQGADLPGELAEELKKAAEIEEEIIRIRAEKEAGENAAKTPSYAETPADEKAAPEMPDAAEYAARNDGDIPVIEVEEPEKDDEDMPDCPLSSAINDLFEKMPPVDKMVDKVNSSLDELNDNLRRFSGEFDKQLSDFADQMMGKDNPQQKK